MKFIGICLCCEIYCLNCLHYRQSFHLPSYHQRFGEKDFKCEEVHLNWPERTKWKGKQDKTVICAHSEKQSAQNLRRRDIWVQVTR